MIHLLAILLALDAVTTLLILKRGGTELNPVMAALIKAVGAIPALLVTHAGLIAAAYYFDASGLVLWAMLALFAALFVNNALVLMRL